MSDSNQPDGGSSGPPDGGQGDPAGSQSTQTQQTSDSVSRKHLEQVVSQRDAAKASVREAQARMDALVEAAGGKLDADELKQFSQWKSEQKAAEKAALEKKGEYDALLETQKKESQAELRAIAAQKDAVMDELRGEKLGALAQKHLVSMDVDKDAAEAATNRMLRDGVDGIKLELVLENGKYVPQLKDSNGLWPGDGKGGDLTFEAFAEKFKEKNSFFFRPPVEAGSGGVGPGATRTGGAKPGTPVTLSSAIAGGYEAYMEATGRKAHPEG